MLSPLCQPLNLIVASSGHHVDAPAWWRPFVAADPRFGHAVLKLCYRGCGNLQTQLLVHRLDFILWKECLHQEHPTMHIGSICFLYLQSTTKLLRHCTQSSVTSENIRIHASPPPLHSKLGYLFTSAERKVKDLWHSEMSWSCFFGTRLFMQSP